MSLMILEYGRKTLLMVFGFILALDIIGYGISFYFVSEYKVAQVFSIIFIVFYKVFF